MLLRNSILSSWQSQALGCAIALWTCLAAQDWLPAQDQGATPPVGNAPADALVASEAPQVDAELLRKHIQNLNSPSYRSRQQAILYLEQHPKEALPHLRQAGKTTDLNTGAEVIALLSTQAMSPDTSISVAAHEALKQIAGGKQSVTAVSQLALNALAGIADRQEVLAKQALEDLGVAMGDLNLTINGSSQNEGIGRDSSFIVWSMTISGGVPNTCVCSVSCVRTIRLIWMANPSVTS